MPTIKNLLLASSICLSAIAANADFDWYRRDLESRRMQAVEHQARAMLETRKSEYQYYNDKTKPYFIESWPDVPFDTGEFYSGNLAINSSDPSRELFFIFRPSENGPSKDLTIWLNGGPGCSSLVGFFQENGPILWQPGVFHPMKNPYSWAKYTNMLWVEQPVGTGFAVGKVEAKNEVSLSKDFVSFFKNFEDLFSIKNYKIYVTGESYAGRYVPYISAEMLDQNDKDYFDLSGNIIYDPCIGEFLRVGQEIPTYQFVKANNAILNINETYLAKMEQESINCGYEDYMDKYLQFPPPGNQPDRGVYRYHSCDVFDMYYDAAQQVNPCFNVYHITDYCPTLGNPMGEPQGMDKGAEFYFNRKDVKKALHAPENVHWTQCSGPVFLGGKAHAGPEAENDRSPDPTQGVLPQVIEATNRVIVSNADWDGLLLTNGTLLEIQNMTWHGKLGFQTPVVDDFIVDLSGKAEGVPGPQGVMGKKHYERGLMWVESYQAGHQQPEYQPRAALMHLQWMLGLIDDL